MNLMQKSGGCLSVLALPFLALGVFMYVDPPEGDTPVQGLVAGLFFAFALGLPGLALVVWGRRERREAEHLTGVTGMIRAHDRFTVEELARKIGRTELETEAIIARVVAAEESIDLVFHRSTREYLHRARMSAGKVVEACASCGAPTGSEVVFEGERVPCAYCGAPLV
jgi:hypothetical protein